MECDYADALIRCQLCHRDMVNRWLNNIQSVLFPPICLLCGSPTSSATSLLKSGQVSLCKACQDELPWQSAACLCCAEPMFESVATVCGRCLQSPPSFDCSSVVFRYASPVDFLLRRLKFDGKLVYARLLGELMTQGILEKRRQLSKLGIATDVPDVIIPVPLHPTRLRERGFNQSLELARWISRALDVPIDFRSCRRVRATLTQSLLPLKKRRGNIRRAFAVADDFSARRVAIVDDVMTTAYTVQELASALRQTGVEQIEVWCCARASLK